MEFILDYIKMFNYKKLIIFLVFIFVFIFSFFYLNNKIDNSNKFKEDNLVLREGINISTISDEVMDDGFIYVDIKGAIKNPGVYKLDYNSRVIDAINIAGGLLKDANTMYINLSKVLNDSDIVKIHTNSEIEEAFKEEKIEIIEPCICEEVICDVVNDNEEKEDFSKININTASIEELDSLNGIGEAKAKAIFEYRKTNGDFLKIEDIMNVSGISESIFEKIKDFITV